MPNFGDKDKNKSLDVNVEVSYTSETPVINGEVVASEKPYQKESYDYYLYKPNTYSIMHNKYYSTDNYVSVKPLSISDLAEYYNNNGQSIDKTLEYLESFITANKDTNLSSVQQTISTLMEDLRVHYDHSGSSAEVGDTKEILEKCIKQNNSHTEIKGLICGPIVKSMVDILQKCDIPAGIVPEINNERHATLVYRTTDGEYVFNNYGENVVIHASNIKDAVSEYSKREGTIHSSGNKRIVNGEETYSEYAFKDSAFRGEEMDIHTYNEDSPFQKELSQTNSINGNVELSNIGNTTVDVSVNLANQNGPREALFTANAGFTKKGETSMFLESKSFGLGCSYDAKVSKPNYTQFAGFKLQTAQITGKQGGIKYGQSALFKDARDKIIADMETYNNSVDLSQYTPEEQAILLKDMADKKRYVMGLGNQTNVVAEPEINSYSDLTVFGRGYIGREYPLIKSENTTLSGAYQATADVAYSFDDLNHSGDFRLAAEGGLKLNNNGSNHNIEATVSGGLITDYNEQYVPGMDYFQIGTKLNSGIKATYSPSDNVSLGVSGNVYSVNTPSATTNGYGGNVFALARDEKHNIIYSANAGIRGVNQKIKLGFNEQTENNNTLGLELGVQKRNTKVVLGFDNHTDRLNSSRNYWTTRVGAVVNF